MRDAEIIDLYEQWSDAEYGAGFVVANQKHVAEFREWLKGPKPKPQRGWTSVTAEDYELSMLDEYRKQQDQRSSTMTQPLIKGGQGRSDASVRQGGVVLLYIWAFGTFLIGAGYLWATHGWIAGLAGTALASPFILLWLLGLRGYEDGKKAYEIAVRESFRN